MAIMEAERSKIKAVRNEGDMPRCGMEALGAFLMASVARYGCSPLAAAVCAAAWLGADKPCFAMLGAILGAAYAKSYMSLSSCLVIAGIALLIDMHCSKKGMETPVYIRYAVSISACALPLPFMYAQRVYGFVLGLCALAVIVPLSAAINRAYAALWAYIRGKRLNNGEKGEIALLMLLICVSALLEGTFASILALIAMLTAAILICRANKTAARELSLTRLKLKCTAEVARERAMHAPGSEAEGIAEHMCGMGNAIDKLSMPKRRRRHKLKADIGSAGQAMQGSPANGDTISIRRLENELLLILSDGMGSGIEAHRESALAASLYGDLMAIGYDEADAVSSINSLLLKPDRAGNAELYATLDAARIDLATGEAVILKQSAPPAFLLREGHITALYCEAPPLGILKNADAGIRRIRLKQGDTLVLMTDGLTDALGASLFAAITDTVGGANTALDAACAIMERACGMGARDDMSAIVARFSCCHKNAQF